MHGTSGAVGTDWAMRKSGSWGSHWKVRAWTALLDVAVVDEPAPPDAEDDAGAAEHHSPIRRMLQRWMDDGARPLGQEVEELGVQVAAPFPHEVAELGRHGQLRGGGELLGDLLHREQVPLVDHLQLTSRARHSIMLARSTARRAMGQVRLDEGDVDHHHPAVADQQVGRLDVAMGQAGVPQPADDPEALVDDRLVHLGLAELLGVLEELEGDQVLALGGERRPHRAPAWAASRSSRRA